MILRVSEYYLCVWLELAKSLYTQNINKSQLLQMDPHDASFMPIALYTKLDATVKLRYNGLA